MIRQAISCDVCGAEKKLTNHWYVACELTGELRLGGWNSRMRQKAGAKHLCGQTCLHKLVDEFIVRISEGRAPASLPKSSEDSKTRRDTDASLTSPSAYIDIPSSARLLTPAAGEIETTTALLYKDVSTANVIPLLTRSTADPLMAAGTQLEDAHDYSSRRWRAEAWERERSRELRAVEHHPEITRRRNGL